MKRIILVSAGIIAMFSAVTPALADNVNGASATGTAAVTILTPIAVKQTQGLDFGSITSGERGGEVVIDPSDGVRSVEGGVGAVAANIGQAGTFAVTGEPNAAISVVVDSEISGFEGGIKGATKVSTLPTILKGNLAEFTVGGGLSIPGNTKAGNYSGTYTVAVNYP